MDKNLIKLLTRAIYSLEEYAEKPDERMDKYPCHLGICDKFKCCRCSRAIEAYNISQELRKYIAQI